MKHSTQIQIKSCYLLRWALFSASCFSLLTYLSCRSSDLVSWFSSLAYKSLKRKPIVKFSTVLCNFDIQSSPSVPLGNQFSFLIFSTACSVWYSIYLFNVHTSILCFSKYFSVLPLLSTFQISDCPVRRLAFLNVLAATGSSWMPCLIWCMPECSSRHSVFCLLSSLPEDTCHNLVFMIFSVPD